MFWVTDSWVSWFKTTLIDIKVRLGPTGAAQHKYVLLYMYLYILCTYIDHLAFFYPSDDAIFSK